MTLSLNNQHQLQIHLASQQEGSEAASSSFTSSRPEQNSDAPDPCTLSQMPSEVFSQMMENLDAHSLRALSCTSKDVSAAVPNLRSHQVRYDLNVFINNILKRLDSSVSEEIKSQFVDIQMSLCVGFSTLSSLNEHAQSIKEKICSVLPHLTKEQLEKLKTISPPRSAWTQNILNVAMIAKKVQEAENIENGAQRIQVLQNHIIPLARKGEIEGVLQLVNMIPSAYNRSMILKLVVRVLVDTKKLEHILEASKIALNIEDPAFRAAALPKVMRALVSTNKLNYVLKAGELAQKLPLSPYYGGTSHTLKAVVEALVATKKREHILDASEIALKIRDPAASAIGLSKVMLALVNTKRLECVLKARDLARKLPLRPYYEGASRALKAVVEALVATKKREHILEASEIAPKITDHFNRLPALVKVEKALAHSKESVKAPQLAQMIPMCKDRLDSLKEQGNNTSVHSIPFLFSSSNVFISRSLLNQQAHIPILLTALPKLSSLRTSK